MPHSNILVGLKAATVDPPTVSSPTATGVTHNAATLGGTVADNGGEAITDARRRLLPVREPGARRHGRHEGRASARARRSARSRSPPSGLNAVHDLHLPGVRRQRVRAPRYTGAATFTTGRAAEPAPRRPTPAARTRSTRAARSRSPAAAPTPTATRCRYAWELDGDGDFADAIGATPTLTPEQLAALGLADGPVTRSIRLGVSDGVHVTLSDPTTLTVDNVAPTATLSNSGPVDEGGTAKVSFAGQADPVDTAFTYELRLRQRRHVGRDRLLAGDGRCPVRAARRRSRDPHRPRRDRGQGRRRAPTYTTAITVSNAAPTATLSDHTVDEGATATVGLTDIDDASAADKAAGCASPTTSTSTARTSADQLRRRLHAGTTDLPAALTAAARRPPVTARDHRQGRRRQRATPRRSPSATSLPTATLHRRPRSTRADAHGHVLGRRTDPSTADAAAFSATSYDFDDDRTFDAAARPWPRSTSRPRTARGKLTVKGAAIIDKDGGAPRVHDDGQRRQRRADRHAHRRDGQGGQDGDGRPSARRPTPSRRGHGRGLHVRVRHRRRRHVSRSRHRPERDRRRPPTARRRCRSTRRSSTGRRPPRVHDHGDGRERRADGQGHRAGDGARRAASSPSTVGLTDPSDGRADRHDRLGRRDLVTVRAAGDASHHLHVAPVRHRHRQRHATDGRRRRHGHARGDRRRRCRRARRPRRHRRPPRRRPRRPRPRVACSAPSRRTCKITRSCASRRAASAPTDLRAVSVRREDDQGAVPRLNTRGQRQVQPRALAQPSPARPSARRPRASPRRAAARSRACTRRSATAPSATKAGLNTVTLAATGRKGKRLKPGTYLLTITSGEVTARTKVWVLAG